MKLEIPFYRKSSPLVMLDRADRWLIIKLAQAEITSLTVNLVRVDGFTRTYFLASNETDHFFVSVNDFSWFSVERKPLFVTCEIEVEIIKEKPGDKQEINTQNF